MTSAPSPIQIDIVSDVVCPWCIVGFKQLEQALARTGLGAIVRWHPFELNRDMPPEGQNTREHIMQKYGSTPEQSQQARDRLTALGAELGFTFAFDDNSRIYNTFGAHLLLDWAAEFNLQHPLKIALFTAYFSKGRDVSDPDTLVEIAASVGLDGAAARNVLTDPARVAPLREIQQFWTSHGITGVPAMVFGGKYLVTGAQGVDNYVQVLLQTAQETA